MSLKIFTGAGGEPFVCDDDGGFGDLVADASRAASAPITSCAREGAAEHLLKKIHKMSQPQLFRCSQHCTADCGGNCNPANPPGFSTHERRNDGVAYKTIRRGALLKVYQRGIDVRRDRVAAFIHEMAKRKHIVTQTYPGSPSESQHVNFRKRPLISLWRVRPLRRGAHDPRVNKVVKLLKSIQEPGKRTPYLSPKKHFTIKYGPTVEAAIKRFQHDHHIKADGIVGVQTYHLLKGTARRPPSRLDKAGIDFLVQHEGERLYVYNDPSGYATYGVGHLLHRSNYTAADAAKYGTADHRKLTAAARKLSRHLLEEDAKRFEQAVIKYVPQRWRESQDRFNAFVSMAFNLGEEILTPQAPLMDVGKALAAKPNKSGVSRMVKAVEEFDVSGGRHLPGLTARRKDEANLIRRNK